MGEPEWKRDLLGFPCYVAVRLIMLLPNGIFVPVIGSKLSDILLPRYGDWIYRKERREAMRDG